MKSLPIGTVLLVCLISGCASSKQKTVYPVTGTVKYHGEPLQNASVIFYREGDDAAIGTRPNGKTDDEGKFQLTTYLSQDGAPAGSYKVLIVGGKLARQPPKSAVVEGDEETDSKQALPGLTGMEKFSDPATTTLSAEVGDKNNTFQFTLP